MLVNPDLWAAFDLAKETLLSAVKTSLLPELHILSLDPADRESARTLRREALRELDTFTTRFEETTNDLVSACNDIRLHRPRVETSLSPIAILPPELIRHIAKLTIGAPKNRQTILNLSHVSVVWREVVTSTSELFTSSDWNKWHVELLTIWLHRAHKQPQEISLNCAVIDALFPDNTIHTDVVSRGLDYVGQLRETLEQALLNCVNLTLEARFDPLNLDFRSWFHGLVAPRLRHLDVARDGYPQEILCMPENTPALRSFNTHRVLPLFSGSSLITVMTCQPCESTSLWSEWAGMLKSLPSLEHLTLFNLDCPFDETPLIHLPALHILDFVGVARPEHFCQAIQSFVVPNLKTLHLDLEDLILREDEEENVPEFEKIEESELLWDSVVSVLCESAIRYS